MTKKKKVDSQEEICSGDESQSSPEVEKPEAVIHLLASVLVQVGWRLWNSS